MKLISWVVVLGVLSGCASSDDCAPLTRKELKKIENDARIKEILAGQVLSMARQLEDAQCANKTVQMREIMAKDIITHPATTVETKPPSLQELAERLGQIHAKIGRMLPKKETDDNAGALSDSIEATKRRIMKAYPGRTPLHGVPPFKTRHMYQHVQMEAPGGYGYYDLWLNDRTYVMYYQFHDGKDYPKNLVLLRKP